MKVILRPTSLKFRIIGVVLLMFVSSVWLLTISIARHLEQDMTDLLESQQFSAVSYVASEIDAKLVQRIDLLNQNTQLVAQYFDSPAQMRGFLKGRIGLQSLFQAGLVVIDKSGAGITDYPVAAGRENASFVELEYFQEVIATGKTVIGKPRIGRFTKKPGVAIATPIRNNSGETIGVLAGFATLSDKNLFGQVERGMVGKSGMIVVSDPRNSLIVSSSNPADILQPLPASGTNFDRAIAGIEGSSLSTTINGAKALVSTKMIPSVGWAVQSVLPIEEAFTPIRKMQQHAYGIAVALTLLVFGGIWFFVRRALKPLENVTASIHQMTTRQGEFSPLALSGNDEIQDLVASFNTLMDQRKRSEEALRQSEERLSRAELASKSGNWELHLDSQEIIASVGAVRIYGVDANHYEFAVIQKASLSEYRSLLDAAMRDLIEQNKPYDVEFRIKTLDLGEIKDIHSIATFDQEKRVVFGIIHDITERLRLKNALEQEESRRRIILDQSRDGISLLRRDGSLVEWNPAFANMLGYSDEELGRINVKDWDIKLRKDEIEEITYHLGLEHLNIETQHRRKDGTTYDVEVSISGVELAGQQYLLSMHRDITTRKQAAAELLESESRLRTIIDYEPECIKIVDAQGRLIRMNPAGLAMIEADSPDQVIGREILDIVAVEHRNAFAEMHKKVIAGESMIQEFEVIGLKGGRRWMETHAVPMEDHGETVHLAITRDITERKQAEDKQRLAATVFSHAREGILITSADGAILDVNQMFSQITGYGREEVLGRNPHLLSSGRHEKSFYAGMWRELTQNGNWAGEIWNRRKNGEIFPEMLTISAVRDLQGKTQQYVALFADITEIKNHEHQLEYMAHYDVLTKLPNRSLLADRLQQAMSQTVRRKQLVTVCYIDLDGFKAVNDRYGHEVGDQLLIALATTMRQALRDTDTLARIGGDEIVAVLLDLTDKESSVATIERLIHTACQPVQLGDLVVQVSASLGVTFYPQPKAVDADQLLRQADHAMYQAKLAGKNRYCVFSSTAS